VSSELYDLLVDNHYIKVTESVDIQCMTASRDIMSIKLLVHCHFKIEEFSWNWKFLVADKLGVECILGADFITHSRMIIDLSQRRGVFAFNRNVPFKLAGTALEATQILEIHCEEEKVVKSNPFGHLSEERKKQLSALCEKFPEVLTDKLGLTNVLEYTIRLTDDKTVRSHPYRFAPPKMELLRQKVDELLKQGVIEPSTSSYASPAFLVPKPGGKSRMVIDFRKVNACIEIDSVPLPDLHSAFDWFNKARYFTIFDLNSAYHQIPLAKESRHITAFCVPWNLFQYTRVPMGLAVGAQTLTRLLDMIFHDLKFKFLFNYLDDLLVYSETWEEHLEHLQEVLKRLRSAGLTVNPDKVHFAKEEISFLGHLVSAKGVRIDPERTQGIADFPRPRDAKGVSRFLGMIGFYRKFIPHVAEMSVPLNILRKKGAKFTWGEEQESAFLALKEAVMSPPVLKVPDFSKPFILQTDASSKALGAVIQQEVDGVRQPVAFASRTLTPQERKASSIYELECLAVVFAVDKFRRYLEHAEFLLETDNQALSWLLAHPRQLGKIGRWVVKLSALKFKVQHIRGTQNVVADALSRMFSHEQDSNQATGIDCNMILSEFPLAFTELQKHQRNDPELSDVINRLINGEEQHPYLLKNGVLCCVPQRGNKGPKVVLPSILIPMVFSYFHQSPVGGHLGILKTISKIRQEYIWKGMDRDIANRVRACHLCSLSKPAQNTKLGLLASEVAERPMEKLFMDYVGPFPRSKTGNTILLVVVDAFTKFVWLLPLRSATARLTVEALNSNLFQHFGQPVCIVTDNGSQFTSRLFKQMCFGQGIQHITTSPYYPKPSHAERFNRNLRSALISFHAEKQENWDHNLRWLQIAFNSALHEGHRSVPYELMFGFKPNNPLSNLWKLADLLPSSSVDVKTVWLAAKKNLIKSQERVRRRYNEGRKENPFKVGQLVYCLAHPVSSKIDKRVAKLCYRWTGPHRISRFLSPVTAMLVDPRTGEKFRKAHISHLKPFKGSLNSTLESTPEQED
jgi:transposase InsO family protein